MRVFAIASLLILAAAALASDKATVSRSYKVDDSDKYAIKATIDAQDVQILADIVLKIKKVDEKGAADVELKMTRLSMSQGGNEITSEPAEPMNLKLDKLGLPDHIEAKDQTVPYAICIVMSLVPGKEVVTGESFKVDWKGASGGTIKGAGTLVGVKTMNGIQVGELKYDIEVDPEGNHDAGTVKYTSFVDMATGKLLKAEGTLSLQGSEGKLSVMKDGWKN